MQKDDLKQGSQSKSVASKKKKKNRDKLSAALRKNLARRKSFDSSVVRGELVEP